MKFLKSGSHALSDFFYTYLYHTTDKQHFTNPSGKLPGCFSVQMQAFVRISPIFPELHPMNHVFHFNGELLPVGSAIITAENRGLRYGDGLFETIKVVNGGMPLFALHMERLQQGLSVLQMKLPAFYTSEYIAENIIDLCGRNNIQHAARVRITVFRGNGTLYTTDSQYASVLIQADLLTDAYMALNETGFNIDVYTEVQKSCDILSNLKSNNYLPYVMAALHAQKQQLNDSLVLNIHGRICDATIANIFWIQKDSIFTPPLSEGCVAGVMRKYLLSELPKTGFTIQEKLCAPEELWAAEEVFLTNALYGIRWVHQFGKKLYSNQLITQLYNQFVKN